MIITQINKFLFAISFVLVRLVFGLYWSYHFFIDCFEHLRKLEEANSPEFELRRIVLGIFMVGNVVLNTLNFFWFMKIAFWVKKDDSEKKEKKTK